MKGKGKKGVPANNTARPGSQITKAGLNSNLTHREAKRRNNQSLLDDRNGNGGDKTALGTVDR